MCMLTQFRLLADYNRLMNERLYAAAELLDSEVLEEDKGAFFVSILGTLNHLMVGDLIWLKRFAEHPAQFQSLQSVREMRSPVVLDQILFDDLYALWNERARLDAVLIALCEELGEGDLAQTLAYRNMEGALHRSAFADLLLHLFLHQTHHRGQISVLLSQEEIDVGETDLLELIPEALPGAD